MVNRAGPNQLAAAGHGEHRRQLFHEVKEKEFTWSNLDGQKMSLFSLSLLAPPNQARVPFRVDVDVLSKCGAPQVSH